MPTLEELHALVDSLPDGAIDAAHRFLSNLQIWPPSVPSTEEMRKRMDEQRTRMRSRMEESAARRPGWISMSGGHRSYDRSGFSSYGTSQWDGDTFVVQTYRQHYGHELIVIERIRIDGQHLVYRHEVSGPGGKRDEGESIFDLL